MIGLISLAFGSVVTICSCLISDCCHVGEHRLAVGAGPVQLASGFTVAHGLLLVFQAVRSVCSLPGCSWLGP
jgi:hypothetical protein